MHIDRCRFHVVITLVFFFRYNTSEAGLPDAVGVLEARNNVVGDGEGEFEAVTVALLEGEEAALGVVREGNWQHKIRPTLALNGEAQYLHFRFFAL